jgi:hypothetical protein
MAETSGELKQQVTRARRHLDQDLNNLQYRVQTTFDWRAWFARRPWATLGAASGATVLLSYAISKLVFAARPHLRT